ncbi:MAG: hypothetical protein QNJ97_15295 [Myxococcota bacterium]|nr:hypothetical protein [Myxococcota bacterium]
MNARVLGLVLGIAILGLMPGRLSALTDAGLFKLSLNSTFFRFGMGEVDVEDQPGERDYDAATVGVGMQNAGIGFGYTVIPGLVVGGTVTLGLQGLDEFHGDDEAFIWQLLPYVEYIFLDGLVRPFVRGTVGFEGLSSDEFGDVWWWGFTFGAGGGAHFFIRDYISLDALLMLGFTVGTGEFEAGNDRDFSHWRFRISALLGMSAWF